MARPRFHRLRIADLRHETDECVSLAFAVPGHLREAFGFSPGQYLTLRTTLDREDLRRSYSVCSGLDDGELRVAIKRLPGGAFSTWANEHLRVGELVEVMTPDGRFGVPVEPRSSRTLLAFAAGSGITPVMSILKTALMRERGQFLLFYGNRTSRSIIFRAELEDLKDRYLSRLSISHVLSRERQDIPLLNGRLDPEKLRLLTRRLVKLDEIAHAFICGPQPMIEGLAPALVDLGLMPEQVHVERFTPGAGGHPAPLPPPASELPPVAEATVVFEGIRSTFPVAAGEAIIDAGARAGIDLPFSCKGGMCCTCRARLIGGQVEMATNYSLETWETDAGYVLTCQSRPLTSHVVIDYDAV